jgi:hypothetical protein
MRSCRGVLSFLAGAIVCFSDEPTRLRWAKDVPNCDYLIENDKYIEIVRIDGLEIRAAISDTGRKMRAQVAVSNGSAGRVDIDPELFTLNVIEPKAKLLKREAPEKLTRSIQRNAAWQTFGASLGSGATKQTTSLSLKPMETSQFPALAEPHEAPTTERRPRLRPSQITRPSEERRTRLPKFGRGETRRWRESKGRLCEQIPLCPAKASKAPFTLSAKSDMIW